MPLALRRDAGEVGWRGANAQTHDWEPEMDLVGKRRAHWRDGSAVALRPHQLHRRSL